MSSLILIIEDEDDLVSTLQYNCHQAGYRTRVAMDAASAREALSEFPLPDLVLLDLMLPDGSGIDLCRDIRMSRLQPDVPVIIMTAKDDEIDRVVGFEVGADDYVTKPFSIRELLLRMKALLRRVKDSGQRSERLEAGPIRVDRSSHRAWNGDSEVKLTVLEFRLLSVLVERRGRVQSREQLLNDVWSGQDVLGTRTVDTHIRRLREKLGSAASMLRTVRGIGYVLGDESQ